MRVALVGWEIDDGIAMALSQLGTQVVAFTRWFPDLPIQEERDGWTRIRCPHQIGGSLGAEALTFRDAVLRKASELNVGVDFDAIHAIDPMARPAASGLRERMPGSVAIGSITLADVMGEAEAVPAFAPDRWIGDHPWITEHWRGQAPAGAILDLVPGRRGPIRAEAAGVEDPGGDGPLAVFWVPRDAALDPQLIVDAVAATREGVPGLSTVVLGAGPLAHTLRGRLNERGWLARSAVGSCDPTLENWEPWIRRADVVGVPAPQLADDPTAQAAWLLGVPVVRTDTADPRALADAIRDTLFVPGRRERDVRAGAALAARAIAPEAIARGWLRVYLDAQAARYVPGGTSRPADAPIRPLQPARCRLRLTAIAPREVYAAWTVRPDDWSTALEWLGPNAARASLVLRLLDVTDIRFRGDNAHGFHDVELRPGDQSRTVALDAPGRSLAASLGVKSPSGFFQPLAHARICHLPREEIAPAATTPRRLGVRRRPDSGAPSS